MLEQQTSSPTGPQRPVSAVPGVAHVVGADIGGTNLRMALADSAGTILARWSTSTSGIHDAHAVVGLIASGIDQLLLHSNVPRGALRAVAVGAPGVTNVDTGVVIATSYLMGWLDVPLRSMLEEKIGIPAAVDNDVNVAAIGESWLGAAKNAADFVFLAIGTGVGAGVVINNRVFRGAGWTAGEIGYMLVPGTSELPAAEGSPGALEAIVGGEGIKAQWRLRWSREATELPQNLLATQIFDHALQGDPLAQVVLQQSARALAYSIFNTALVLDCPLFILGGTVGMHPALGQATRAILEQRRAQVSPILLSSALGSDAQLIGTIRLALDEAIARPVL